MAILDKFKNPAGMPMAAPSGVGAGIMSGMKPKPPTSGQQAMDSLGSNIAQMQGKPAMVGLGGKPQPAQFGSSNALMLPPPKRPGPFTTERAQANAQSNLDNLSMQDLQRQANGGTLPPRFGEARPLLGNTKFRNLQPRRPGPGTPAAAPGAPAGDTEQSYAGFAPYLEEQTAGAPRRISGFRGKRPGARFTEGPMRGKTLDQAKLQSREQYASLSPEQKASYESKSRMEDISSPVPARQIPKPVKLGPSMVPQSTSIDPAELMSLTPGRPGRAPLAPTMPMKKPMGPKYPGGFANPEDAQFDNS